MRLGILNEEVEGVWCLLHNSEKVRVLPCCLCRGFALVVVLFAHVFLVARCLQQRDMHVEVVGELDGADELRELVLEVLAAGRGHHEVVLHGDGETMPHGVASKRFFRLWQDTCRGLVRHARGNAFVKRVYIPFELLVWVFKVFVGQNVAREW